MRDYLGRKGRRYGALLVFACAFLVGSLGLRAQSCTTDIPLSNITWSTGNVLEQASNSVTTITGTAVVVNGSANVTFTAGSFIKLEPGFEAHSQGGATFHAKIQSCTATGPTVKEYIRLGNRIIAIENH